MDKLRERAIQLDPSLASLRKTRDGDAEVVTKGLSSPRPQPTICRGTSLIKNNTPLGLFSMTMPRALQWS